MATRGVLPYGGRSLLRLERRADDRAAEERTTKKFAYLHIVGFPLPSPPAVPKPIRTKCTPEMAHGNGAVSQGERRAPFPSFP